MNRSLIFISEPNIRCPVDTSDMHPANVCLDDRTSKIVAHLTFELLWYLYLLPHKLNASLAKPLVSLWKLFEDVVPIA